MTSKKPSPLFFIVVLLVVLGLLAYAFRDTLFPKGTVDQPGDNINPSDLAGTQVEGPDPTVATMVQEYTYVSREKLPPVPEVSNYKEMEARTVKFALNVWAGWAPIILQNGGASPGVEWTSPEGEPFKVELVLIDDPVAMRDAYAGGQVHIGWSTLDMLPLFMEELQKDPRMMPRVFQQVDWSNGGDGIVFRRSFAKNPNKPTVADLRGKTIVLAQNSPSEYFVLNALVNGGIQPSEVNFKYTQTAFEAAAAFNADKNIAACVSWAPDIYNLSEVDANHLLVSTLTANRLIADVWFARADFARDNPDICEGLVRGIFAGMERLKSEEGRKEAAKLMGDLYGIPQDECLAMLGDAHPTNYAENRDFLLNRNNPANFENTWNTAYLVYKKMHRVQKKVAFDKVMDFSIVQKLQDEEPYKSSVNEYKVNFAPQTMQTLNSEGQEILAKTITIQFFPNSTNLDHKVTRKVAGKDMEELYDPNVEFVLAEVAKLAAQYGAANIIVQGHADSSMKGQVSAQLVKKLSSDRAEAVRKKLLELYSELDPNQFNAEGKGWDVPANPADPKNHAKNRRVEIKVIALEQPGQP